MKTKKASFSLVFLVLMVPAYLALISSICFAAEEPIQVEADKMTSLEKTRTVVFTGNVDARQGDVKIRADEMTVHYSQAKPGETKKGKDKDAQQVEKITCTGNVEVTSEEWLGTSDTMHYFSKKNLVQLIGNAKAYKGQNTVAGEKINYYIDTGKSEVMGGTKVDINDKTAKKKKGSRVNMTILEQ